jgi:hypothetical protein
VVGIKKQPKGFRNSRETEMVSDLMQEPSCFSWTHHVIAPLYDGGWNVPNVGNVVQNVTVRLEETAMDKIMARKNITIET